MPLWGILLCLLTAISWAISPILIKSGMQKAGPNEVNPIRSIGFLGTMSAVMLITQPGQWPSITPALALGLFLNIGLSTVLGDQLYFHAIKKIGASLSVSISSGYPLVTTLLSIWILGESVTKLVWAGTLMIILGILIIRYDAGKRQNHDSDVRKSLCSTEIVKGIALAMSASFLWGANIPFIKKLMLEGAWSPVEFYFLRSVAFTIIVWTVRIVQQRFFPRLIMPLGKVQMTAWIAFIAAGSLALAWGGVLFGVCVEALPVSIVTPITASSPFITVLMARLIHKERLSRSQQAGVTLVILGSIAVNL